MARIQTYINDNNVTLDDKVIGTDAVDNSTKNFTVGDMLDLTTSVLVAGTGIDITGNTISCTVVDTNDIDFVSHVALVGTDLQFTGTGHGFSGAIDLSNLATASFTAGAGIDITNGVISSTIVDTDTNDIDYIDQVILNGNILDFAGIGNAFTGGVDLSQFENIYTAGTGIDITNNVISASAVGAYSYIDNVTLAGTDLIFAGLGSAFGGTIDLSSLATGTTYTAGTNIDITNNVISCTVTDTNTTYAYGAVGAAGNILFALSGSDSTNSVVTMAAGQNITLTDNGNNNFTIAAAGGVTTLAGLSDTTISAPSNNDTLKYNGSAWVNTPAVTSSGPERLVMKIATGQASFNESEIVMASNGSNVANNTVHYNINDLALNGSSFEIANDCTMRIALASYLGSGGQNGNVIFRIYEFSTGSAILVGEAAFVLSNATSAFQPKTFFSYFEGIAGQTFKFTVEAQQSTATIGPGSYIEVEIID